MRPPRSAGRCPKGGGDVKQVQVEIKCDSIGKCVVLLEQGSAIAVGGRTCRKVSWQGRRKSLRMTIAVNKDAWLRYAWDFCVNYHSYDSQPPSPASRELPPMGDAGQPGVKNLQPKVQFPLTCFAGAPRGYMFLFSYFRLEP